MENNTGKNSKKKRQSSAYRITFAFVNRYLTKEEIIRYLTLSDVYMTPYLGKDQAVSGTLAYAVGYGRVIVSTPYPYASEMLADGRGLLADFAAPCHLKIVFWKFCAIPKKKRRWRKRRSNSAKP